MTEKRVCTKCRVIIDPATEHYFGRNGYRCKMCPPKEEKKKVNREWELKTREKFIRPRMLSGSRARSMGAVVEDVSAIKILERDGQTCHMCGLYVKIEDLHFDHVVPLTRGGSHTFDNIKVAHSWCNITKGNKMLDELWWGGVKKT